MKNNLFSIIHNLIIIVIFVLILIFFIRENNDFKFIKCNNFESQKNKNYVIIFHLFKKHDHLLLLVFFFQYSYLFYFYIFFYYHFITTYYNILFSFYCFFKLADSIILYFAISLISFIEFSLKFLQILTTSLHSNNFFSKKIIFFRSCHVDI